MCVLFHLHVYGTLNSSNEVPRARSATQPFGDGQKESRQECVYVPDQSTDLPTRPRAP